MKKKKVQKKNSSKAIGKKRSTLTFLLLALALTLAIFLVVTQKMSADSAPASSTYKEVGKINYSFKVVDKTDNTKVVAGLKVAISLNSFGQTAEEIISDAQGIASGGGYSICTKDSNTYMIRTKGCAQSVTKISARVLPASGTHRSAKMLTVQIGNGYSAPQFKEKFVNKSGDTSGAITGQWSLPTSLVYSDNSGGKVEEVKVSATKYYEIGSVDIPVQIVDRKDKTKVVSSQYIAVEPSKLTYHRERKLFSSKLVATPTKLPSLNLKGTSDAIGLVSGGHYVICLKGNQRFYIMDAGCKNTVDRLSIYLTNAGGTKLARVSAFLQGINRSGSGYSAKEFVKFFAKKDGTASQEIKGDWKSINNSLLYSDGSGGKTF